jgi:hypothetical protein
MSKLFSFLFLLVISTALFAQPYRYQLKGTYKLDPKDKSTINYSLEWNEEDGKIMGLYHDNYFIDSSEVMGEEGDLGRNFTVKLPNERKGVRSITMLISAIKDVRPTSSIPVSVVTRDAKGSPLTTTSAQSFLMTTSLSIAQKQEETCQEGFGSLSGFCGIYGGMITEEQDRRNKCNLLFADGVKLELSNDSSVTLHLGEPNQLIQIADHEIGRLPANPQTRKVDVMSRSCRPLQGVNAPGDTCKRLNLRGEFSGEGSGRTFRGVYSIHEEGTNNYCAYRLSLDVQG